MDYTSLTLLLIPAVIGYTEAVKSQFPALSRLSPFIAVLVSFILYYAHLHLPNDLFMTIYGAGASMGLYTGAKILSPTTVTVTK